MENEPAHQDLAHKRPWLLLSLLFGGALPLIWSLQIPEIWIILSRVAAVGLLAFYSLRRHHEGYFIWLAAIFAAYAAGQGLDLFNNMLSLIFFATGHVLAIGLFAKHRRKKMTPTQKALAISLLILPPILFAVRVQTSDFPLTIAFNGILVSVMAAAAWSSSFPRYRTGLGAVLYLASVLVSYASIVQFSGWESGGIILWYSYYVGLVLIATGVVQTLVKQSGKETAGESLKAEE